MFSKMDKMKLANTSLRIARMNANLLTGNLRYNAISKRMNRDGFSLIWDGNIADYWHYLDEGTENHRAFRIVKNTQLYVMDLVSQYSQGGTPSQHKNDYRVMKQQEDDFANERFGGKERMMKEREIQKELSLMRAKGVIR